MHAESSSPPHLYLIRALGGDERSGKCECPAHDDNKPSLSITAGHKQPVVLHCHARCSFEAVTSKLREMGLWPVPGTDLPAPSMRQRRYSDEERRRYALRILDDTRRNRGQELAYLLENYFARRGINAVPPTALLALCHLMDIAEGYLPNRPAMIFPVINQQRPVGIHVTWMNSDCTDKCDVEPQRQTYGPVKGGHIELYEGDHAPAQRLLIAEGIETALAAAQLTGLPALSALNAKNMPLISPPAASEYIIAGDNDANGSGQRAARALAAKLVRGGAVVRIAIPPQRDTDWNDVVCSRGRRGHHGTPKA